MARAPGRVRVGRIVGAHGVRGRVRLHSFLEAPEAIGNFKTLEDGSGKPVRLALEGVTRKALVARVQGVETREAAQTLAGTALYVPRSLLPAPGQDEYYETDLVGLEVIGESGGLLGTVVAVADFGSCPLLEVRPEGGGSTVYLPFTREVVPRIEAEAGRLHVALLDGLWPDGTPIERPRRRRIAKVATVLRRRKKE